MFSLALGGGAARGLAHIGDPPTRRTRYASNCYIRNEYRCDHRDTPRPREDFSGDGSDDRTCLLDEAPRS